MAKTVPVTSDVAVGDAVIWTQALTKVYPGDIRAVDSLDLTIAPGEIFGLLGPNGAGKTTTVGMLTTRVVPTSGRARVFGIDVVAQPDLAKQAIGIVPQTNTLDRSLSVYENLYIHGRFFGMGARESKESATRLLERFLLADRARFEVDTLSGGMAQRLMVARAVMHRPQILFLDEPTAGLDPQSRIALWDILGELHRAGQTILLTTHYMEEADRLCDRVAIMDHGRILALGTPAELKRSSGADTVAHLQSEGEPSRVAEHMAAMPGAADARAMDDGTVHVWLGQMERVVPQVIAHAERGGVEVTDLSVSEPTLETVFIRLTGRDLRE